MTEVERLERIIGSLKAKSAVVVAARDEHRRKSNEAQKEYEAFLDSIDVVQLELQSLKKAAPEAP